MSILDTQIETERLLLRVPKHEDFERYAELFCDAGAAPHIGGGMARSDAWRRFLQMPGAWAVQGFAMFSLVEKSTGLWVGQAGPWMPDGWPGTEVGYALHPAARGCGYATEGCRAAIEWAFGTLGWTDVIHCIAPANTESQKVAERLGSKVLGKAKFPPPMESHDCDVWGQTREQWRARRSEAAA